MNNPRKTNRAPIPKSTLFGVSKVLLVNLLGGFFLGVSFMAAGMAGLTVIGVVEFHLPDLQPGGDPLSTSTPAGGVGDDLLHETSTPTPVTVIIPATPTPLLTGTATATVTPDFAATATSACGNFLDQFPGTPCPETSTDQ